MYLSEQEQDVILILKGVGTTREARDEMLKYFDGNEDGDVLLH